jgi:hypothetical protein
MGRWRELVQDHVQWKALVFAVFCYQGVNCEGTTPAVSFEELRKIMKSHLNSCS